MPNKYLAECLENLFMVFIFTAKQYLRARMMITQDWIEHINILSNSNTPFLFIISYDKSKAMVFKENEIPSEILFDIQGFKNNTTPTMPSNHPVLLEKYPVAFEIYKTAFDKVFNKINKGYSYLANLTFPTELKTNLTLEEVFYNANAKYRLFNENKFVVYSPECFIKILQDTIYTFPMKGTIDANIKNAERVLMDDEKEKAEHYTVVDLLRNDLSQVATKVEVNKFRYIDKIKTHHTEILQTSSEICGALKPWYKKNLGSLLDLLLPAGSICGAPKSSTLKIIHDAEMNDRGYYTGVFGFFDGQNLDSGVMIRFIEQQENKKYYRSGGGITSMSDAQSEYNEMIEKIYVPIH